MARKKSENGDEEAPAKGRGRLVPAVIIGVAVLAGAYMMKPGGGGAAAPEASSSTEADGKELISEEREPGTVLALDSITLNLADGRFLKVGMALQLAEGVDPAAGGHGGGGDPKSYSAQALDTAISVLGGHTYEELVDPANREKIKRQLSKQVSERYHGDIIEVFFTEFVMQ